MEDFLRLPSISGSLGNRSWGWGMACFGEPGSAQGLEEGGRETDRPAAPLAGVLPGIYAFLAMLPSIWQLLEAGGCAWETCDCFLRFGRGERERLSGNYRQPCARPAQTSSRIPSGSEP